MNARLVGGPLGGVTHELHGSFTPAAMSLPVMLDAEEYRRDLHALAMYALGEGGMYYFQRLTNADGGTASAYQLLRAECISLIRVAPTEPPDESLRESSNGGDNETYAFNSASYHTAEILRRAIAEADGTAKAGEVDRG